MKVVMPRCSWCNDTGAWLCKRCNKWTCSMCVVEITDADRCTHRKYEPAESQDWTHDQLDQMMRNA